MAQLCCLLEATQCWIRMQLFEHFLLWLLKWSPLEVLSEFLFHPGLRAFLICWLVGLFELCRMHLTYRYRWRKLLCLEFVFWQWSICVLIRYLLMLSSVLFMKIFGRIFLIASSRVISRRFFTGPWVFFGIGRGNNTPVPSFLFSICWVICSDILFSILLISWWATLELIWLVLHWCWLFVVLYYCALSALLLLLLWLYHVIQPLRWGYEFFYWCPTHILHSGWCLASV